MSGAKINEVQEQAAKKIIEVLKSLQTDMDRCEVFCLVDKEVCIHCGSTDCSGWCDYESTEYPAD